MTPTGLREKRLALASCNGLLVRACDELETLLDRGASAGLAIEEVADVGPLAQRVINLRRRRHRLQDELHAITGEWTV